MVTRSPGASKVDQTHKFDDFLDLTQFFQICERDYVNDVIYNNFKEHDQLMKMHSFLFRSL